MPNRIVYTPFFVRKAKDFKKKHTSVTDDLKQLESDLLANPKQGADLGNGLYKVRLAVKSKGKGKSGGYRVITYLLNDTIAGETIINMLTLYDKSEEGSIDKQALIKLVKELFH